jgi:ankyrin repeat protein
MALYELHQAVKKGDLHRVSELLDESPLRIDINQADHKGWTPLMYAVACAEAGIEILRALIRHGVSIDQTAMSYALSDLQKLKVLIKAGADIRYQKEHGYDALINAAYGRDVLHNPQLLDILNLLIANGVSLKGMTTYGESAIRVLSRIGRFDAVELLLKAGANPDDIKFTKLIEAVAFGSLADVETEVKSGAALEERDYWERTPWHFAIQTGDIARAKILLEHGADRNARGRGEKLPLFYAIENRHVPMLRWLLDIGTDIEQTDDFGRTALIKAVEDQSDEDVDVLLKAGANVHHECKTGPALSFANTRGIAMKLMEAGADPQHLRAEGRRAILGFPPEPDEDLLEASETDFAHSQTRRPGERNPEVMSNPFWEGMIRSGINAYQAGRRYGATEPSEGKYRAIWCAQRFGQSLTFLPDGRLVQVGGEHEDFYDPDFCIYNDVFVHQPDGTIVIYGYPESEFPPTDFHTATLIGDFIYLIGSLGYPSTRQHGETPVYKLDTRTLHMERLETTGTKPGWIYHHRAVLSSPDEIHIFDGKILSCTEDKEVHSDNSREFILDIGRRVWRTA